MKKIFILTLMTMLLMAVATAQQDRLDYSYSPPETSITFIQFTPNETVLITNISIHQGSTSPSPTKLDIKTNSGVTLYTSTDWFNGCYPQTDCSYATRQLTFAFPEVNLTANQTYRVYYTGDSTQRGYSSSGLNPNNAESWNIQSNLVKDAFFYAFGYVVSTLPELTLSTDIVNNSIIYQSNYQINYSGVSLNTDETFNCSLYLNDILNQTDSDVNISQTQSFSLTFGEIEEDKTAYITCENEDLSETTETYKFKVDNIQPRIIINSPSNNTIYYTVLDTTISVDVDYENINLQQTNTSLVGGFELYNNYTGINTTTSSDIFNLNVTDFGVGNYTIRFFAEDLALAREKLIYVEIQPCPEDWQPTYTSCTIGDNHTLYYTDANSCGTYDNLPVDNSTISSCNYCTISFSYLNTTCQSTYPTYQITTYPVYDNFATCCNVTGLSSDCDLPVNTTVACVGAYEGSDIPKVVIDGLVEFGIEIKKFVPLIVLLGLAVLLMNI